MRSICRTALASCASISVLTVMTIGAYAQEATKSSKQQMAMPPTLASTETAKGDAGRMVDSSTQLALHTSETLSTNPLDRSEPMPFINGRFVSPSP